MEAGMGIYGDFGRATYSIPPPKWMVSPSMGGSPVKDVALMRVNFNIWLWINTYKYHFQGDEHPFTSYFEVHQGYKVLTHCHIEDGLPTFVGYEDDRSFNGFMGGLVDDPLNLEGSRWAPSCCVYQITRCTNLHGSELHSGEYHPENRPTLVARQKK